MRRNIRLYLTFVFIILLAVFAAYIDVPSGSKIDLSKIKINFQKSFTAHLGLDLQGGSHLEYQADLSQIPDTNRAQSLEAARGTIERRVYLFGVQEPLVETSGTDRIIVELPGITNINQAIAVIGQTPYLDFREQNNAPVPVNSKGQVNIDANAAWKTTGLSGKNLTSATADFDQNTGQPIIRLQFDSEGTKLFADITQRNIGKPVAIFLDGAALSTPTVQTAITDGQAVISGQFTVQQAKDLADRLNSGALPVPIHLISQQNVGATLGHDSIQKSIVAGIIGLILIIIFMIVYYRLPGLLAVLALAVYALLSFAVFKIGVSFTAILLVGIFFFLALTSNWIFGVFAFISYFGLIFFNGGLNPVTLTLAGIAGFILSIGMAVDANILIFERTKEELRLGKEVNQALEDGFTRAWSSIRDSNVSSLITTLILYIFGTPEIKSFAITLSIGIIVSLFTAITVTKTFLRMFIGHNILAHPWLFGASKKKES